MSETQSPAPLAPAPDPTPACDDDAKYLWQSKTFWASAITALVPLIPGVGPVVGAWIAANPALFSGLVGAAFCGLRVVTNSGVKLKK